MKDDHPAGKDRSVLEPEPRSEHELSRAKAQRRKGLHRKHSGKFAAGRLTASSSGFASWRLCARYASEIGLNPNPEVRSAKHAKGRENNEQNRLWVVRAFCPRSGRASPSPFACFACLAECISEFGLNAVRQCRPGRRCIFARFQRIHFTRKNMCGKSDRKRS